MEVSVNDAKGLPEGCLLSVRAGSTRRQAPVPLREPLRFPNLPFNAKHFKVDVMMTLGSARLDINAQQELESYVVAMELGGAQASLGLTVREEPSLCGKRSFELKQMDRGLRTNGMDGRLGSMLSANSQSGEAFAPSLATPSSQGERPGLDAAKRDMCEYAKEHNISNLMQEMLQQVLRERPAAPYSVMASYLRRKAAEQGEVEEGDKQPPEVFASPGGERAEELERLQLEAEHLRLHAERAALLQELAALESK